MSGKQKLWVCLLLVAGLCTQYASGKRGFNFRGRGKGDTNKAQPSQSQSLSKQGLKLAGVAAAGVLGGTGTGYGLGFLGRPKHGPRNNYDRKTVSSEEDQRLYHNDSPGYSNQSLWTAVVKAGAPASTTNIFLTFGVFLFITAWIRDI